MALARFSLIFTMDKNYGISKNEERPWMKSNNSHARHFRDITTIKDGYQQDNYIIMGRKTWEEIPIENRPLPNRKTVVISSELSPHNYSEIIIYKTISEALKNLGQTQFANIEDKDKNKNRNFKIFIIGGGQIFNEIIENWMYLADEIFYTTVNYIYDCTMYIPFHIIKDLPKKEKRAPEIMSNEYTRFYYDCLERHQEHEYLDAVRLILSKGTTYAPSQDRMGVGYRSYFDLPSMKFDLTSGRLPAITTRTIEVKKVFKEFMFFLRGDTDTTKLEQEGVDWWKRDTSATNLAKYGIKLEAGDMGASYGFQLRHAGAEYEGCDKDYTGKGVDQMQELIDNIKKNPFSRRHAITCFSASQSLQTCVVPPCHSVWIQFKVSPCGKFLDVISLQRSCDILIGGPYNIIQSCLFGFVVSHMTGLKLRYVHHKINDAHIYLNQEEYAKRQLARTPYPFPKFEIRGKEFIRTLKDFTDDSFDIVDYVAHPRMNIPFNT